MESRVSALLEAAAVSPPEADIPTIATYWRDIQSLRAELDRSLLDDYGIPMLWAAEEHFRE